MDATHKKTGKNPAGLIAAFFDFQQRRYEPRERPWPKISVVTPSLNAASTIGETIESVLSQHYPNLEYLIIDGGSTDRTEAVVQPFAERITAYISEVDDGMYDALRKGFGRATGEVFAYLNADDLYLPGALRKVGAYFRDHPRKEVIYFEDVVEIHGWRFPNAAQPHVDLSHLAKGHILYQDGVFFTRKAYESAGGFNPRLKLAGDWELWVRMARRHAFHRLEGHVSCFRIHEGQLTSERERYDEEMEKAKNSLFGREGEGKSRSASRGAKTGHGIKNLYRKILPKRRLFFPIPFAQMPPPPGEAPPRVFDAPVCPLTGNFPDRLLFSSRDSRFGGKMIHHWYYSKRGGLALCYPPMGRKALDALYENCYSDPSPRLSPPLQGEASPYANYNGASFPTRLLTRFGLPRGPRKGLGITWEDKTGEELIGMVSHDIPARRARKIEFIDIGCFEGKLLEDLSALTNWRLAGLESNAKAVQRAREKGFEIWEGHAEDAVYAIPHRRRFDLIFLGQTIEHLEEPLLTLRRLRHLLKPEGRIVLSTPNLDSWQIDRFGPTWAHWHPPFHRYIFSLRALKLMGRESELKMVKWKSNSHPYWSAMSLQLNELGLGGAVPHGIPIPKKYRAPAESMAAWSKLCWDRRGRGDILFAVYQRI